MEAGQAADHQALVRLLNPMSPTTRRTARVLQEMRLQGGLQDLDLGQHQPPAPPPATALRPHVLDNSPMAQLGHLGLATERRRLSGNNFDDSFGSGLGSSPDEAVIQARGRRQVPLTFSPDLANTPLRQQMQRAKLAAMSQQGGAGAGAGAGSRLMLPLSHTRTSPRKRLTLSDTPPPHPAPSSTSCINQVFTPSPDKLKISPLNKKVRVDPVLAATNPGTAIKGLSHGQLVGLVSSLLHTHPELVAEVHQLLPAPDLGPLEERLSYLKKNIYKALPSTRLESKTDSMAYNRVSLHLTTFKKAVLDSMRGLLEAEQWLALVDYTVLAWGYVSATPVWENPAHNNTRRTCFKSLAASAMTALNKGSFTRDQVEDIKKKMLKLREGSDEINICIKHIEESY